LVSSATRASGLTDRPEGSSRLVPPPVPVAAFQDRQLELQDRLAAVPVAVFQGRQAEVQDRQAEVQDLLAAVPAMVAAEPEEGNTIYVRMGIITEVVAGLETGAEQPHFPEEHH